MIIHYTGYSRRGGGIQGTLANVSAFLPGRRVLGVGPFYPAGRLGRLRLRSFFVGEPDRICPGSVRASFRLALALRWREAGRGRRKVQVHGHTREGLLTSLWLWLLGDSTSAATVHVLGTSRWFYRWAFLVLGDRLACLGPVMKQYYDIGDGSWAGCLPDCVGQAEEARSQNSESGRGSRSGTASVPCLEPEEESRIQNPESGRGSCSGTASVPCSGPGTPLETKARNGSRSATFTIGCAGGLVPVKEWELAGEALSLLPACFRVTHAGAEDGGEVSSACAASLHDALRASGASHRWKSCGQVSDMAAWLRGIDCLLVCGRREAMSLAALEAAAAGIPVLAPRGSGARDVVEAFGTGMLFKDGDAADLARALGELRERRVSRAPVRVPERFTAPSVASGYAALAAEPGII